MSTQLILKSIETKQQSRPSVEVIILSAYGTVDLALDGMHLGAFDYVAKAAEFEELHAKIEEAYQSKLTRENPS
jgi:DNA-binding NtrC family response regulator